MSPARKAKRKSAKARPRKPKLDFAKPFRSWFKKFTRPFKKNRLQWIVILLIAGSAGFFFLFKDLRPVSKEFDTAIQKALQEIPGTRIIDRSSLPKENWVMKWNETRLFIAAPQGSSVSGVWGRIKKKIPPKFHLYREAITQTGMTNFVKAEYRISGIPLAFVQVLARKSSVSTEFLEREKETVKPKPLIPFLEALTKPRHKKPAMKRPLIPAKPSRRTGGPQVAIVIDDVGNSNVLYSDLFSLPRSVTIAILPELAHSQEAARWGLKKKYEIILHQPVEATHHNDTLGPGGIFTAQRSDEITSIVRQHLDSLPGVSGSNNHMGSRGTADLPLMRAYLRALKEKGYFFLDSWTTQDTVGDQAAHQTGVSYLKRSVFLDNIDTPSAIRAQMRQLIARAKSEGRAIAIGHIRKNTLSVLRQMIPEMEKEGIQLVRLKDLL
jgi:polysaccharide deacetylase 2 family uncharacterized protein YibQ